MKRRKLSESEIGDTLDKLPKWELIDGKLQRSFQFDSFSEAIGWIVSVAIFADRIDHHPEWFNVYGRVDVTLHTHDLNALSTLDVVLAKRMDELAAPRKPPEQG